MQKVPEQTLQYLNEESHRNYHVNNRLLHGFHRHLGCGAVAAKITANVWDIVQLSTPITPRLYIGF